MTDAFMEEELPAGRPGAPLKGDRDQRGAFSMHPVLGASAIVLAG